MVLVWAAPSVATADTTGRVECVIGAPGTLELGVAGKSFAYSKALPCVPDGDAVSDPTIEWGDGTTSEGTVVPREAGGVLVTGEHVYASPGWFTVRATVTDEANGLSYSEGSELEAEIQPAAPVVPVTSGDPPSAVGPSASIVSATGRDFTVRRGTLLRNVVALIRSGVPASYLHARISWGDGTTSHGTVTGAGVLQVSGRHRWRRSGRYAVVVTLTDASGRLLAKATGHAVVVR